MNRGYVMKTIILATLLGSVLSSTVLAIENDKSSCSTISNNPFKMPESLTLPGLVINNTVVNSGGLNGNTENKGNEKKEEKENKENKVPVTDEVM